MTQLVLSLFPGIGLLDMAFEEEGFCIVRGRAGAGHSPGQNRPFHVAGAEKPFGNQNHCPLGILACEAPR